MLHQAQMEGFERIETWAAWITLGKAILGEPLTRRELGIFQYHTGLSVPRPGGYAETLALVGRRAGKTLFTAALSAYLGVYARYSKVMKAISVVSVDEDQARAVFLSFSRALFDSVPALGAAVVSDVAGALTLASNTQIRSYPCLPESTRGPENLLSVLDEVGFMKSRFGESMAKPMLTALRPSSEYIVMLSSSMVEGSVIDELAKKHYGKPDAHTLIWKASTREMNETYSAAKMAALQEEDAEAFESEFLGEAKKQSQRFLEREQVEACVERGVYDRLPQPGWQYYLTADPSQRQRDSYVTNVWGKPPVGHPWHGHAVQCRVQEWGKVRPGETMGLDQILYTSQAWMHEYHAENVIYGDQAFLHIIADQVEKYGMRAQVLEVKGIASDIADHYDREKNLTRLSTSVALSRSRTPILRGLVHFLDIPKQTSQWANLILKRSPTSGKETVMALGSGHDDFPSAAAWGICKIVDTNTAYPKPAVSTGPGHAPNYGGDVGQGAIWNRIRQMQSARAEDQIGWEWQQAQARVTAAKARGEEPKMEDLVMSITGEHPKPPRQPGSTRAIGFSPQNRRGKARRFPKSWAGDGPSGIS
jgi:hypothetical protein